MGYLVLMVISALGSGVTAYLIWGFAHDAALLYVFVVVFGMVVSVSHVLSLSKYQGSILRAGPSIAHMHLRARM